jgi:hypothetical protein
LITWLIVVAVDQASALLRGKLNLMEAKA